MLRERERENERERSNVPLVSLVDGTISDVRWYFTIRECFHARRLVEQQVDAVVPIVIDYENEQRMR